MKRRQLDTAGQPETAEQTALAPLPVRLSVATLNVWTTKDKPGGPWPARIPALQKVVRLCNADIIGVQEAHPEILAAVDEALPTHARIAPECEADSACWTTEGTIYYRKAALELLGHGAECAGSFPEKPNRRLFWARFRVAGAGSVLFTTCHMPWQGSPSEVLTGVSARFACSHAVADALKRLSRPGEAAFCVGDFNESFGPPRVLRTVARFVDCFTALCLSATPTHPARPSTPKEEELPDRAIDWICANEHATPILANVMRPSPGLLSTAAVHASDHFPVVAVYEI